MEYGKRFLPLLLLLSIFSLTGCAGKLFVPFATWVQLDIVSDENINPDDSGRASPVVVRIYELKDVASFQSKDFFEIYDDDAKALGESLIKKEELNFRPNETSYIERKYSEEAAYIGVFVAFRNIDDAQPRAFYKLHPSRTNKLKVDIKDIKVSISQNN